MIPARLLPLPLSVLLLLGLPFHLACHSGGSTAPVADPVATWTPPVEGHFENLTWTGAFDAAQARFAKEYAFTQWKQVDWAALGDRIRPLIVQAQATGDARGYYLALHQYICAVPDGHVSLAASDPAMLTSIAEGRLGGGYGLAAAELDDGRTVAGAVLPGGPADLAGMVAGAELQSWNGQPAWAAIGAVDLAANPYRILAGGYSPSTENAKATGALYRLEQARLLGRGPVGSTVTVRFLNPGAGTAQTATLEAAADGGATFQALDFAPRPDFSSQVDSRILPGGYGYLRLRLLSELPDLSAYPDRIYADAQAAIQSFLDAGAPGMVLDLRGCYGGSDQLAADLCGFFYDGPAFYEDLQLYDARTGGFLQAEGYRVAPRTPHFGGSVAVLANANTVSSGEGPCMVLPRLARAALVGFHGTNGSFGVVGTDLYLPGGYRIRFPYGRSVDANGVVQGDSRDGVGGASPGVRVPKTLQNVLDWAGGTDVELAAAVAWLQSR
jgi:carboxyl-terminal processing protease